MNPAPTPRTDAAAFTLAYDEEEVGEIVGSDFARQLERELAEAKTEIAAKSEQWRMSSVCRDAKHQAERLAGALKKADETIDALMGGETCDHAASICYCDVFAEMKDRRKALAEWEASK